MPDTAYTFTPSISVDGSGKETISVEDGTITSSASRRATMDVVQREAQDSFYEDENGELHSDIDTTEQDAVNLVQMIGEELYSDALKWASENLEQEDIAAYDKAIENASPAEAYELMQELVDEFRNDSDADVEVDAEFADYFYNNVMSEETYEEVTQYIADNYEDSVIEQIDGYLESGDYQSFMQSLLTVIEQMRNK